MFNPNKKMTIMKKMMLTLACVFSFVACIKADNYQPITRAQLPSKAQTFLSTYFADAKTSLLRRELDVMELNYDVIFTDGSKVEFDHRGYWTEVDCVNHQLPEGIVPTEITNYINAHYPGAQVVKIERDHREFEVTLSNRVELTFNKKLQLIDID